MVPSPVPASPLNPEEWAPEELLPLALEAFGRDRIALVSSLGVEGMVVLDMLTKLVNEPRVITVDTGRLPEETLALIETANSYYGIEIEVIRPDRAAVEDMVRARGADLFYESVEARVTCCSIRKHEPFARATDAVDAWITGMRREQTEARSALPKVARDPRHGGRWRLAPLADWTTEEVWTYARRYGVPYNRLHDRGYPSIGCAPCTRAVPPGADERAGRWWWEKSGDRECGLHFDPGVQAGGATLSAMSSALRQGISIASSSEEHGGRP